MLINHYFYYKTFKAKLTQLLFQKVCENKDDHRQLKSSKKKDDHSSMNKVVEANMSPNSMNNLLLSAAIFNFLQVALILSFVKIKCFECHVKTIS